MKKVWNLVIMTLCSCVTANASLAELDIANKDACLKQIAEATDAELWDVFLKGQTELFFESEFRWIEQQAWWQQAQKVLELGSGNGAYLNRLSDRFPEKSYCGVEIQLSQVISQTNAQDARENVTFQQGDAEVFNAELEGSADVLLFRYTLQHLQDPMAALNNAAQYLASDGYIVIFDSYDTAHQTSHPILLINDVMDRVAELQSKSGYGNRKITSEIMAALQSNSGVLPDLYDVIFTNIDAKGNLIIPVWFIDKYKALPYVKHALLMLALVQRVYHVAIEMRDIYDALIGYLDDKNAWDAPGIHCLVLKKR